ncbi:MAG TPA: hypothetical protein PKO23_12775 [Candidatus Hydrogenedentes bacterium]|nr:hypothetical protein [Candidatus Hydrogenedentota bacterium]
MKNTLALRCLVCCIASMLLPVYNASAAIPLVVNHQGRISIDDAAFSGVGAFRFALVDSVSGLNLWTNDGSGIGTSQPPVAPVSLVVTNGVYTPVWATRRYRVWPHCPQRSSIAPRLYCASGLMTGPTAANT